MTSFNAARVSRFIRAMGRVDWKMVSAFLDEFGLRGVALANLRVLRSKKMAMPGTAALSGWRHYLGGADRGA